MKNPFIALFFLVICCCGYFLIATFKTNASHIIQTSPSSWRDIEVTSKPHTLTRIPIKTPAIFDKLIYRGGLVLTSDDKNFGGFSGLHLSHDGTKLLAITDRAQWLRGELIYNQNGDLIDLDKTAMSPITRQDGRALKSPFNDSEGLSVENDEILVSFERQARIDAYRFNDEGIIVFDRPVADFSSIKALRSNRSMEGITHLENSNALMATIETRSAHNTPTQNAMQIEGGLWHYLNIVPTPPFQITEIDEHKGTLYLLERYFSRKEGLQIRLSTFSTSEINNEQSIQTRELAVFSLLQDIDNFEGLSLFTNKEGRKFLSIISDNNFNTKRQKTLLLLFEIKS